MMRLNSHLFYEETLFCGTRASKRSNLLDHVTMPNPVVPIPFVDDLVNQRRVNVALSRAKDGLFIIGAVSALSRLPLWA
ncbi:hypothetical protein Aduo_010022 [Ancylostoma duodenale]